MVSSYLFVGVVGAYTLLAAATDLRKRRIPNWLTVPAAVAGLSFHLFAPSGWGLTSALAGFAIGFGLLLLPFLIGGGGAGDVKLLAALGVWLGPHYMLVAFVLSIGAAALLAIGVLFVNAIRNGIAASRRLACTELHEGESIRVLPFAVPVAVCTWCMLAWLLQKGLV